MIKENMGDPYFNIFQCDFPHFPSCRAASEKIRCEKFKNYIILFYGNRKKDVNIKLYQEELRGKGRVFTVYYREKNLLILIHMLGL